MRLRLQVLREQMRTIEVQLADRNRTNPAGKRLSLTQYRAWRRGALKARAGQEAEYLRIKAELAGAIARVEAIGSGRGAIVPETMLEMAYDALSRERRRMKEAGLEIADATLRLLDVLRDHLTGVSQASIEVAQLGAASAPDKRDTTPPRKKRPRR